MTHPDPWNATQPVDLDTVDWRQMVAEALKEHCSSPEGCLECKDRYLAVIHRLQPLIYHYRGPRQGGGCDGDPIECSHEAARVHAEATLARMRDVALQGGQDPASIRRQIIAFVNRPQESSP